MELFICFNKVNIKMRMERNVVYYWFGGGGGVKVMVGDFDTVAGKRGRKQLCPWKEVVWGFMVVCNVT